MKDKPFYDQSGGGGVTFSGGEPLMQLDLVQSLAARLHKAEVPTAVESCMHVPWKNIEKVAPHIDCWLADLKHVDDEKFLRWAKGSLKRIKDNYRKLAPIAKRIVIRVLWCRALMILTKSFDRLLILQLHLKAAKNFTCCRITPSASTNIACSICPMSVRTNR